MTDKDDSFKKTVFTVLISFGLLSAGWFVWATQQIFSQTSTMESAITRGQLKDQFIFEDIADLKKDVKDTRERLIVIEAKNE